MPPNSKMTKKLFCFRRLALTFAAVSQCTTLSRESRKFKFLFPSGLSEFCSLRKLVYFDSRPRYVLLQSENLSSAKEIDHVNLKIKFKDLNMIGQLVESRASRVNTNIPVEEEEKNALQFGKNSRKVKNITTPYLMWRKTIKKNYAQHERSKLAGNRGLKKSNYTDIDLSGLFLFLTANKSFSSKNLIKRKKSEQ